jgi:hypothetical protein
LFLNFVMRQAERPSNQLQAIIDGQDQLDRQQKEILERLDRIGETMRAAQVGVGPQAVEVFARQQKVAAELASRSSLADGAWIPSVRQ